MAQQAISYLKIQLKLHIYPAFIVNTIDTTLCSMDNW